MFLVFFFRYALLLSIPIAPSHYFLLAPPPPLLLSLSHFSPSTSKQLFLFSRCVFEKQDDGVDEGQGQEGWKDESK